jgi:hypothetical protein
MTFFVGIDWADTKHDICVLNAQGQIVSEFIIPDDLSGYLRFQTYLQTLPSVKLLIERPNGRLVDFLLQNRWPVYVVPPNVTAASRPKQTARILLTLASPAPSFSCCKTVKVCSSSSSVFKSLGLGSINCRRLC